ncbi:hypothetical protein M0D21_03250 [Aquimarina sp. D1M17]|uniref:sugar-transfer associated ATP-grasp domain-containing protein n=1 Tax=Aquimarina acroporae TaxID=2937283 RepID=UPI0020C0C3AF|nr:sugar-transfer associated ATP-grasp domain-containing protein [Aquimarina acroporae]MCK8520568.1 hypothetical protein [Aquimarina acroporae]
MKRKLKQLKKRISVFWKDENRKGIFQIIWEVVIFWFVKGELPYFYFGKFLYRKDVINYKDYLSSKEVDSITLSKNLHHYQYASLLRNKLAFALYMERNQLPVPKLLGYNFGSRFFLDENVIHVADKNDLAKYFKNLFNTTGQDKIFVKAIKEMGGEGCYLICLSSLANDVEKYGKHILSADFICQEVVQQHELINKIYEHSVNTIRFDTYIDKNNQIHILSAFMRFGRGGNVVDNGSAGGFYLSINLEEGTLKGYSHQLMKYGGERLQVHPDTNIVFDGYKIPYFEESCALIKKAVSYIPDRIIGWDIAIGENGPIIIEGNDNNSFITPDIAYGGYLGHPLFQEILEEAKTI